MKTQITITDKEATQWVFLNEIVNTFPTMVNLVITDDLYHEVAD